MIHVLSSVADVLQIAHDTGFPHPEPPPPPKGAGGGASAVIVVIGVVVSLAAVAGLIWLKRRVDAGSRAGEAAGGDGGAGEGSR